MIVHCIDDERTHGGVETTLLMALDEPIKRGLIEIGFSDSMEEGIEIIERKRPTVSLIDLSYPGWTPERTMEQFHRLKFITGIIVITGNDDEAGLWKPCNEAGALNYLQKLYYFDMDYKKSLFHAIQNTHNHFTSTWFQKSLELLKGHME